MGPNQTTSQDPPRTHIGPVIDVVGSTFDNMVTHNHKDALVMFYAPWGQHSDFFKPIYEEMAAQVGLSDEFNQSHPKLARN